MTFFKALSAERIAYIEQCHRAAHERTDEFFERDGWRIERWCPHRQADLTRFGEIDDGVLTCSLHHWRSTWKPATASRATTGTCVAPA